MNQDLTQEDRLRLELIRLKKATQDKLDVCFDSNDLASRPSVTQLKALSDTEHNTIFAVCPNRVGKSQFGGRAVSWWLQNNHPHYPSKEKWGNGFNILIVGRTTEIVERELWEKKIMPFLAPGSWKPRHKSGGGLAGVKHESGNSLIFMSHHDAKNAREKVQGFTTPIVWIDEMPDDSSLVTELMLRTSTEGGVFLATFTPLVENEEIRKIVDSKNDPDKIRYHFMPEENPKLMEEFGGIEKYDAWLKARCATEAEYRARRFGEWYYRSGRVIRAYNPDFHMKSLPKTYRTDWPHVAVVDPSASGLTGFSVWALEEGNGHWWCIKAETLDGDAAYLLVKEVEKKLAKLNVIKRICDCNPAGFYKEALRQGITYEVMNDKTDRKNLTIENVNSAFYDNIIFLTPEAEELAEECMRAKWSETNPDKMIHASSFHLIDTTRYFIDRRPLSIPPIRVEYENTLHMAKQEFRKQLKDREKKKDLQKKKQDARMYRRRSKFGRRKA